MYLVTRDLNRARMESGLKYVEALTSFKQLPQKLLDRGLSLPQRMGLELDVLPVQYYQRYQALFPAIDLVDVSSLIREVRSIKSDYEIAIMQDSAVIAEKPMSLQRQSLMSARAMSRLLPSLNVLRVKRVIRDWYGSGTLMRNTISAMFFRCRRSCPGVLDAPLGGLGMSPAVGQGQAIRVSLPESRSLSILLSHLMVISSTRPGLCQLVQSIRLLNRDIRI